MNSFVIRYYLSKSLVKDVVDQIMMYYCAEFRKEWFWTYNFMMYVKPDIYMNYPLIEQCRKRYVIPICITHFYKYKCQCYIIMRDNMVEDVYFKILRYLR